MDEIESQQAINGGGTEPRPVMIVISGGRSTPAILGILALQPRCVEFVNSHDEPRREAEIRTALTSIPGLNNSAPGINVYAYDMADVQTACHTLVERHRSGPFIINLSGGSKIMAIGAYEYARKYSIPAIYVDTVGKRAIDLVTDKTFVLPLLRVQDYLRCFGRTFRPTFDESGLSVSIADAAGICNQIVAFGDPGIEVLERIRVNGAGKDEPRSRRIKNYTPQSQELDVWRYLVEQGFLNDAFQKGMAFEFILRSNADFGFLTGGWFELYCLNQAQRQITADGTSLFDDIAAGFEIPSGEHGARKEIDLGLMYSGQMIHCSCKSGANKIWSTEHLDELSAVSGLIGGRFCSRIFITTKRIPQESETDSYQEYQRFLNQAKDREIVVVTGEHIHEIGAILAREARNPTFRRV